MKSEIPKPALLNGVPVFACGPARALVFRARILYSGGSIGRLRPPGEGSL